MNCSKSLDFGCYICDDVFASMPSTAVYVYDTFGRSLMVLYIDDKPFYQVGQSPVE